MYLDFRSDNTGPIADVILESIINSNTGCANPYGQDPWTKNLVALLTQMIGRETQFVACSSGTACNTLALSLLTPKHGSVTCHKDSHIVQDECSGPEYFLGGKLVTLDQGFKVSITQLDKAVSDCLDNFPHCAPIKTLSITQPNEWGLVYTLKELEEISRYCSKNGIKIHIDGARMHNALAHLNVTLKALVDACNPSTIAISSTKNGGMNGEILIILDNDYFEAATYLHKKFGHLTAKTRFLSAQMLRYFENDYWIKSASNSNLQTQKLMQIILRFPFLKIITAVETNQVFINMDKDIANDLKKHNVLFYQWSIKPNCYRFVVSELITDYQLSKLETVLNNINNAKKKK
jgi:threonine aldolase